MLSWSSDRHGDPADISVVGTGDGWSDSRTAGLWRFASACAERDDAELAAARDHLVSVTDTR